MALITIPFTFSAGAVIIASQHNSNFSTIYSDYNGNIDNTNVASGAALAYSKLNLSTSIVNADISASAAIVDTKLATLSTAGKVNISALTVASQAQGDVIYASGATTWARLGPGTSGQFLKTQGAGANPAWASAGALSFVSATAVSAAATSGNIAIVAGGYYLVVINVKNATNPAQFQMRINADAGSDYQYVYAGSGFTSDLTTGRSTGAASILLGTTVTATADSRFGGYIYINPTQDSVQRLSIIGQIFGRWTTNNQGFANLYADWVKGSPEDPTSFSIISDQNYTGNIYLYRLSLS